MRLILNTKDNPEEDIDGVLVRKDGSFLFLRLCKGNIYTIHWSLIDKLYRIYKSSSREVNIEVFRKGRD